MTAITFDIEEEKLIKLRKRAKDYGLPLNQFLTVSIEELIEHPSPDFDAAVQKVLGKNADLYKRLA